MHVPRRPPPVAFVRSLAAIAVVAATSTPLGATVRSVMPTDLEPIVAATVATTENRGAAALDALLAPNAVIVDEDPPFVYRGTRAASAWAPVVAKTVVDGKIAGFHGFVGAPTTLVRSARGTYAVLPATYTGTIAGQPFRERGTFTYVLVRSRATAPWRVENLTWSRRDITP